MTNRVTVLTRMVAICPVTRLVYPARPTELTRSSIERLRSDEARSACSDPEKLEIDVVEAEPSFEGDGRPNPGQELPAIEEVTNLFGEHPLVHQSRPRRAHVRS